MAKAALCYQLRVHLLDSTPEIWRRILVPADITLEDLHWILQSTFAWQAEHLYQFSRKSGQALEPIYPNFGLFGFGFIPFAANDEEEPEEKAAPYLRDVLPVGDSLLYTYDLGDDWRHLILCESLMIKPPRTRLPTCIDGAMNHAMENVGGIWGYQEIVNIIANQQNPDYREAVADLQAAFGKRILKYDASAFDPKKIRYFRYVDV